MAHISTFSSPQPEPRFDVGDWVDLGPGREDSTALYFAPGPRQVCERKYKEGNWLYLLLKPPTEKYQRWAKEFELKASYPSDGRPALATIEDHPETARFAAAAQDFHPTRQYIRSAENKGNRFSDTYSFGTTRYDDTSAQPNPPVSFGLDITTNKEVSSQTHDAHSNVSGPVTTAAAALIPSYHSTETAEIGATNIYGTAFSDSGYGSLARLTVKGVLSAERESDTMSIYSGTSTVVASVKDDYIEEFVDELVTRVLIDGTTSDLDSEGLLGLLPDILRAFAQKVVNSKQGDGFLTVSWFIHKYRNNMTESIRSELRARQKSNESSNQKVEDWLHADQPVTEDPDETFLGVNDEEKEQMDSLNERSSKDAAIQANLQQYHKGLIESPAYQWLLARIRGELRLSRSSPDSGQRISNSIRSSLLDHEPKFRHISRGRPLHLCGMRFDIDWDFLKFHADQKYGETPAEAFERAITLTGHGYKSAQALTTAEYLRQTWPLLGDALVQILRDLFQADHGSSPDISASTYDGTKLRASFSAGNLVTQVTGAIDSITEIGEALGWLGSVLRPSLKGEGVTFCTPFISNFRLEHRGEHITIATCAIKFDLKAEEIFDVANEHNGRCWHGLFRNPVVAQGFPILRRPQDSSDSGLELPLGMMTQIMGTKRISDFGPKVFIKRFSRFLVLTKRLENLLIWHLICNDEDEHISYDDHRIQGIESCTQSSKVTIPTLESSRHVVGWCSNVRCLAATPQANYKIGWSRLPKPNQKFAFEKVSISAGKFVTAGVAAAIGKKDKPVIVALSDDYISKLEWIAAKFVILHDLDERRAWLLDGASALLHLVRAYLRNRPLQSPPIELCESEELHEYLAEQFRERQWNLEKQRVLEELRDLGEPRAQEELQAFKRRWNRRVNASLKGRSMYSTSKEAAFSVLTDPGNMILRLHAKPVVLSDKETINHDSREWTRSRKHTGFKFSDKVQDIHHVLEQIITYQSQNESEDGIGYRIKKTPRRQLEGFDFMQVATNDSPFMPRVATLKGTGRGWVDFTRSINAITLFGRGFGELITPLNGFCTKWTKVPRRLDYLAVCSSDLDSIMSRYGDQSSVPWRLIDDIHWITPDRTFDNCKCSDDSQANQKCDRAQVLLPMKHPKSFGRHRSPSSWSSSGAVLFGHSRKYPLRWGSFGSPRKGDPTDSDDEDPESLVDSGLGSSVGPEDERNSQPSSSLSPPLAFHEASASQRSVDSTTATSTQPSTTHGTNSLVQSLSNRSTPPQDLVQQSSNGSQPPSGLQSIPPHSTVTTQHTAQAAVKKTQSLREKLASKLMSKFNRP